MPDHSQLEMSTPRLRLRAPCMQDAAAMLAVYEDTDVCRYLPWKPWACLAEAQERMERHLKAMVAGETVLLLIVRAADEAVVGDCTLFHLDAQCRRAEVGYSLVRAAWGQGIMQEAVGALLRFGFSTLDLNRVEADIDPRNTASARSLERLGFVREGLLRERWIVEGEVSDSALYGLLRSAWAASEAARAT